MTDTTLSISSTSDPVQDLESIVRQHLPVQESFKAEFGKVFRFSKSGEFFDLYIEGLFATPPKLFRVNSELQGLGSDLLEATLQCDWTESTLLSLIMKNPSPASGKYHLGQTFPLYLFSNFPSYTLTSLNPSTLKNHQQVKVILTDCFLYQVVENQNSGYLVAYGSIKSIKSIKTFAFRPNCICVTWRGPVDYVQVFAGTLVAELVERILALLNGVKFIKTRIVQKTIKEEDVAPGFIMKIRIDEIEAEIIETELEIEGEMRKEKINALINLYQKAIEYYSAVGDEKFDSYLGKIRGLMANPDVLKILTEEEVVVKRNDNAIVEEFEQQEIWPENVIRED